MRFTRMMVIGILFTSSFALAANDNTDCARLKAEVSVSTIVGGKEPWRGTAILSLDGEQIVGDLVAWQDFKSIQFFPDGSYEGREVAYFTSTAGNFEVEDWYRVEPTDTPGKLMFHADGNIVTGDGRFQSTFGRMKIRGPIYTDGVSATSELKANGSVCTLASGK